ncbi:hypothetical protein EVJ58_g2866 [Rhodofomes roseus]|uniref:Uncharacterized protein n=1 Tax=Rhodofomes roseus TaxID=34475 RepID=A0A4Y9YNT2_9APHY|nr:hypothetical protein EVJ58_g2866 [Rhodofomes roseus]
MSGLTTNAISSQFLPSLHLRQQSPTTYRSLSTASPPATRVSGMSYASVAARPPSPTAILSQTVAFVINTPTAPPSTPETSAEIATEPAHRQVHVQSDPDAGWHVVSHKGKSTARQNAARRAPSSPKNPGRKRRRAENNVGNDGEASVAVRHQDADSVLQTAIPSESSSNAPSSSGQSRGNNLTSTSTSPLAAGPSNVLDSNDAMTSELEAERLLGSRSGGSLSSLPDTPSRTAGPSRSAYTGSFKRMSVSSPADPHLGFTTLPALFPLPSSSILSDSPQTPTCPRRSNARDTSPVDSPVQQWDESSDDEPIHSPTPQNSPLSPPEVAMEVSPEPPTPIPSPNHHHRNRHRHRSHGRCSAAASSSTRLPTPSPSPSLEPAIPFDVESLDPDVAVPPTNSWCRVQGDSHLHKSRGMAPDQRVAWDRLDNSEPVIIIQIPLHGTEELGASIRITILFNVFVQILHLLGASFLPGYSDAGFHGMNKEPYWYLVHGLPINVCIELVRMGWLSSSPATINFDFWRDHNPHLCAVFRLIHRFGAQTKAEYEEVIRREFIDSSLYNSLYDTVSRDINRGGMWEGLSHLVAIEEILASVDVGVIHCRVAPDIIEPVAIIYLTPPTADEHDWTRFWNSIKDHTFGSSATSNPVHFEGRIWCGYCHSLGHTVTSCSIRTTFAWHDNPLPSQPMPIQPAQNAANNRGRGRGNGRGMGRGGRGGRGRGGNH